VSASLDRRALLARLAYGGALLAACVPSACANRYGSGTKAVVPLVDLPPGGRLKIRVAGKPVELRRTAEGVAARSLLCTHTGCTVAWDEARQRYLCPCHEGVYDSNGAVLSGAPTAPLADVPVTVAGKDVVVGA